MQVNSISFGKKIPIAKAQILRNNKNKFIPVYFNEYDCQDKDDIIKISKLKDNWLFKEIILYGMGKKNRAPLYPANENTHFYTLEKENGKIIGICETFHDSDNININFIETNKKNKYKYSGQLMLATIAKNIINKNGKNLYIKNPSKNAYTFYTDACGFVKDQNNETLSTLGLSNLIMETEEINKFIENVEQKINTPIINLMA